MPRCHHALDSARGISPVPQAGKNRNAAEIPFRSTRVVAGAARIHLQVHTVHRAGKLTVGFRNDTHPIRAVVISIRQHMIAQVAEHHAELHGRGQVVAVFIVEINRIQRGYSRL